MLGPEHKFDTVVVDEGQDFHGLWWTSLEAVFRSPGGDSCYYVFYDPKQNLFVDDPALPEELGRPFELPVNCRTTIRVAAHCATLAGYNSQVLDGAPLGDEPAVIRTRGMQDAFRQAKLRVLQLCHPGQGGLARSQVAVLVPSVSGVDLPTRFADLGIAGVERGEGRADHVLEAVQWFGGGCSGDHREAGVALRHRPGQCEPLRGEIPGQAPIDGDRGAGAVRLSGVGAQPMAGQDSLWARPNNATPRLVSRGQVKG